MNPLSTQWRPAQVRLAPAIGQLVSNAPGSVVVSSRPAFIDSPLMAVLMDVVVGAGAIVVANGHLKNAKTHEKNKDRYKNLAYLFFGLGGLFGVKFFIDSSRLSQ